MTVALLPRPRVSLLVALLERERAAALAASVVHVAPPQRWTHGQDEAPAVVRRGYTHVASGIWGLRQANEIGDAAITAAKRFGADYTIGIEGAHIESRAQRSGSADCHDIAIGRAEAVTRHHLVARLLGPVATELLVVFICMDLSVAAMQRLYLPTASGSSDACVRTAREIMRAQIVALLKLLPGLYARIDRHAGKRPDAGDDGEQFGE